MGSPDRKLIGEEEAGKIAIQDIKVKYETRGDCELRNARKENGKWLVEIWCRVPVSRNQSIKGYSTRVAKYTITEVGDIEKRMEPSELRW